VNYTATLIVVKDTAKAKQFYHDILGLEIITDSEAYVTMTGCISLQSLESWKGFIHKQDHEIVFGNNAAELYFEEDDIEGFTEHLSQRSDIEYVHPLVEHDWGQRVVRFYDPDRHIIEVGENQTAVIKRFIDSGLSIEETAKRMDVPVSYVESYLE
jgi:catechol 2,3-dioxygenase-like lactoylglutathione lyase family enzyme